MVYDPNRKFTAPRLPGSTPLPSTSSSSTSSAAAEAKFKPPPRSRSAEALVEMGRYGWFEAPCGTVGLGTCVGLIAFHAGLMQAPFFVAHIPCGVAVRAFNDGNYRVVRLNVMTKLNRIFPRALLGDMVRVATGARGDHSANAIIAGISDWAGRPPEPLIRGALIQDSILANPGGAVATARGRANNERGIGPFSVP